MGRDRIWIFSILVFWEPTKSVGWNDLIKQRGKSPGFSAHHSIVRPSCVPDQPSHKCAHLDRSQFKHLLRLQGVCRAWEAHIKVERKDGVIVNTVVRDGDFGTHPVPSFSTSVENSSDPALPKAVKGSYTTWCPKDLCEEKQKCEGSFSP